MALREADGLDAMLAASGKPIGPLHGVPFSAKDNIDIAGLDSTIGLARLCNKPASSSSSLSPSPSPSSLPLSLRWTFLLTPDVSFLVRRCRARCCRDPAPAPRWRHSIRQDQRASTHDGLRVQQSRARRHLQPMEHIPRTGRQQRRRVGSPCTARQRVWDRLGCRRLGSHSGTLLRCLCPQAKYVAERVFCPAGTWLTLSTSLARPERSLATDQLRGLPVRHSRPGGSQRTCRGSASPASPPAGLPD